MIRHHRRTKSDIAFSAIAAALLVTGCGGAAGHGRSGGIGLWTGLRANWR